MFVVCFEYVGLSRRSRGRHFIKELKRYYESINEFFASSTHSVQVKPNEIYEEVEGIDNELENIERMNHLNEKEKIVNDIDCKENHS